MATIIVMWWADQNSDKETENGKNSTKVNFLKVIQGGKAKIVKSTKALTHKDIKEFLAKFAEAILVAQERVNKLPLKNFHPFYDDGMWQRNWGRPC